MSVFTVGKRRRSLNFYRQNHKGGHGHVDRRWPTKKNKPPIVPTSKVRIVDQLMTAVGQTVHVLLDSGKTVTFVAFGDGTLGGGLNDWICGFHAPTQTYFPPANGPAKFSGHIVSYYSENAGSVVLPNNHTEPVKAWDRLTFTDNSLSITHFPPDSF